MHQAGASGQRNEPIGDADIPTTAGSRLQGTMLLQAPILAGVEQAVHAPYVIPCS